MLITAVSAADLSTFDVFANPRVLLTSSQETLDYKIYKLQVFIYVLNALFFFEYRKQRSEVWSKQ